ncbi:hypothetical protein TKK_0008994 [Trichogramma kaykai]
MLDETWWEELKRIIREGNDEHTWSTIMEVSVKDARDLHGNNLLHYVTVCDNENITKKLLEAGCDVNVINRYGETPLTTAIEFNNLKVAKVLLDAGAIHLNTDFDEEFGPLHMAVWYGYYDMVKIIIEAGADVNVVDEELSSPLHLAAKVEEYAYEITKLLLDAGSNVNVVDHQAITPLHWAVSQGNYDVATLLLNSGANVDVIDLNFMTPLHWCVRENNLEFSHKMIEAGCDIDMVDSNGSTCLHYAVKANNIEMIKLLLSYGATPNCTDDQGHSPLHWAIRENRLEQVKMLIAAGADVNIMDDEDDEGLTALQIAAELGLKEIMTILLDHGADVKAKCNRGYSVLYYAAMSKRIGTEVDDDLYVDILETLLSRGASVGDNDYDIKTPFNSVLLYGNERAVKLFLQHGVDLTKCILGASKISSLHHAALNNDKSVLKFLIDSGHFNVEEKCGTGLTALHLSSLSNRLNCIKFLLKRGADINSSNMYGETPLYSAVINGRREAVRLLLQYKANINAVTTRKESILEAALEVDRQDITHYCIRHMAMLEAQNEDLLQADFDRIYMDDYLQDYYELCLCELTIMKEIPIVGHIKFFHILTAPNIDFCARNEKVVETFKSLETLAESFPIYHDLLIERFNKELKRQELIKKATVGLSKILKYDADTFYLIFYNILCRLHKKDLQSLIDV